MTDLPPERIAELRRRALMNGDLPGIRSGDINALLDAAEELALERAGNWKGAAIEWEKIALKAEAELALVKAAAQAMEDSIWEVVRECTQCQKSGSGRYCSAHDRPALAAYARERRIAGLDPEPIVSLAKMDHEIVRRRQPAMEAEELARAKARNERLEQVAIPALVELAKPFTENEIANGGGFCGCVNIASAALLALAEPPEEVQG